MADVGLNLGILSQGQGSNKGKPPKNITLSATAVRENTAVGTAVAMVYSAGTVPVSFAITADPDGKFALRGNWLLLAAPLDYETATAHRIEITASNSAGWIAETFTIAVTDVAEAAAPKIISLSATSVSEDAAAGAVIATISSDGTPPIGFAITADPDEQFAISGDRLVLAGELDYETATAHQVKITATNSAGTVSETFTIAVTDVAEAAAPTAIALSATAVPEDAAVGAAVATISADGTAPVAFAIAADPDGRFAIAGDELRLAAALDHETKAAHDVVIRASNAAGSVDQAFTIAVTDVAEAAAPTAISLSATAVPEDAAVGTVVATISANGSGPVTFTLLAPPADLSLSATSVLEDAQVGAVVAIISADSEAVFSLVA